MNRPSKACQGYNLLYHHGSQPRNEMEVLDGVSYSCFKSAGSP